MQIRFGELRHLKDLARALGSTVEDLESFSLAADQTPFYTRIHIPKRGKRRGQFRTVYKAQQDLALHSLEAYRSSGRRPAAQGRCAALR